MGSNLDKEENLNVGLASGLNESGVDMRLEVSTRSKIRCSQGTRKLEC